MRNTIEVAASQSDAAKRQIWQAAEPEIRKILRTMEDMGYCPSAVALVQIILGTAIVDPDDFMERADDLFGGKGSCGYFPARVEVDASRGCRFASSCEIHRRGFTASGFLILVKISGRFPERKPWRP